MDLLTSFLRTPKGVKFEPERIGHMDALWIKPDRIDTDSVVLFLHGGAYGMGSIRSHKKLAARIARSCRSQSLLIEYRLAPENPFPAAVEDAVTAVQWLHEKGFQPKKIVIGGDSAGGGLTIATLLKLKEMNVEQPLAAFCLSPWLDLEASSEEIDAYQKNDPFIDKESVRIWGKKYAGDQTRNPLASPCYATDFNGTAPLLIQVGTSEILLFENRKLYERLLKEGHDIQYEEYKNMIHVFQVFGGFLPQSDKAIDSIGRFILGKAKQHQQSRRTVQADA
jgi:acetyl esterase/lipase